MRTAAWTLPLLLIALGALWWWQRGDATPVAPTAAHRAVAASPSAPDAAAPHPDTTVRSDATADAATFVSEIDGEPVADPVRDGITVLVLGPDRKPRGSLPVWVGWGDELHDISGSDSGTLDDDGRFATTIADVESVEWIVVSDPTYGDFHAKTPVLGSAGDPRTVVYVLTEVQTLTVKVVDEGGAPVPDASVTCSCDEEPDRPREFHLVRDLENQRTGPDGTTVLLTSTGGQWIAAYKENFETPYQRNVQIAHRAESVTLTLLDRSRFHDVTVTVLGPDGPLDDVNCYGQADGTTVIGSVDDNNFSNEFLLYSRRIDDSRFVIAAPNGPWRCQTKAGNLHATTEVATGQTEVLVRLAPRDHTGMARVRCLVQWSDPERSWASITIFSESGSNTEEHIHRKYPWLTLRPDERVCLRADVPDGAPVVVGPLTLRAGEQDVVMYPLPAHTVVGRVVDADGSTVAGATVSLVRPFPELVELTGERPVLTRRVPHRDTIRTDDDGRFSFDDVGPGPHTLRVQGNHGEVSALCSLSPEQREVQIVLGQGLEEQGTVTGCVRLSTSGQPVAGAWVAWWTPDGFLETRSDDGGRYTILLPPGDLSLQVTARNCTCLTTEPVHVATGRSEHDIVMQPGEPLFVRILDEGGKEPEIEVVPVDAQGDEIPVTRHDGRVRGGFSLGGGGTGRLTLGGMPTVPFRLRLRRYEGDDVTVKDTMYVDVPADAPRDRDFEIVWQPDGGK